MMRKSILDLRSDKQPAPRFCDVIVDGKNIILEVKLDKDKYARIYWNDLVYQVEIAKEQASI